MLLPISAAAKGVLWFIFFGLAKTTQYTALAILGVKGWRALRTKIKENKQETK
jgi:phosphoglycolate phosphatase